MEGQNATTFYCMGSIFLVSGMRGQLVLGLCCRKSGLNSGQKTRITSAWSFRIALHTTLFFVVPRRVSICLYTKHGLGIFSFQDECVQIIIHVCLGQKIRTWSGTIGICSAKRAVVCWGNLHSKFIWFLLKTCTPIWTIPSVGLYATSEAWDR